MDYSKLGSKRQKRRKSPHATRMRNKIGLILLRLTLAAILVSGVGLIGAGIGLYLGIIAEAPEPTHEWVTYVSRSSVIINARTGEEMHRLHAGQNFEHVTIDQIPLHVQHAFIAIEDERFLEHNGIDMRGIMRAIYGVVSTGGRSTQGASTITQQLIKNMQGAFESTLLSKLHEQYMAVNFERELTESLGCRYLAKDFILEAYLNIINLGRTSQGISAAAWFYYGVEVGDLTIAQAATIAAIAQNPTRFPPDIHPARNWGRAQDVLRAMLRNGFITEEEFEEAMREEEVDGQMIGVVYSTIFRVDGGGTRPLMSEFDCFVDALIIDVRDDLMRELNINRDQAMHMIYNAGLRIYATQDLGLQAIVDDVFLDETLWPGPETGFSIEVRYYLTVHNSITDQRRHYRRERTVDNMRYAEWFIQEVRNEVMGVGDSIEYERQFFAPQPQGAFVLLDHSTGHVVAMRGIRGEKEGNRMFNRATQATRQPGSQLKPIVPFAVAFDLGIMQPATVIDDIPFTHVMPGAPTWTPSNWYHNPPYEGLSTVRRAIYRSMNIVSARGAVDPTIPSVGMTEIVNYMRQLGFSTIANTDGPALVIGGMTYGVRLIELAGAFGAIANLGEFNRPILYTRVYTYEGGILLDNYHAPTRVFSEAAAYLTLDAMKDTLRIGTGFRANWVSTDLRRDIALAGKTGTSERNRDLGFTGSTPYFTASIWLGNDNDQPMHRRTNEYHTPLWRIIMERIHENMEPRQFRRPEGIVQERVCLDSGHLASDLCVRDPRGNRTRMELFASALVPRVTCEVHQEFTYCTTHGYLASDYCPPETVVTRVGIVRPMPIDHVDAVVGDRNLEFPIGVREGIVCEYHEPQFPEWDDIFGPWNDPFDPWIHIPIPPNPNITQPPTDNVPETSGTFPP